MNPSDFDTIRVSDESDVVGLPPESRQVIVLSTHFNPRNRLKTHFSEDSARLLDELARVLKPGGWMFIYGTPKDLPAWGVHLMQTRDDTAQMAFKYWIALDIDDAPSDGLLEPAHLGLLMFLKARTDRATPQKFTLNTDTVRMPHANCAACGRTLKDWGGKKHLMNPRGAALSDVWRDLPRREIRDSVIPKDVLARLLALTRVDGGHALHVIQDGRRIHRSAGGSPASSDLETRGRAARAPIAVEPNQVLKADCVSFLNDVAATHPDGLFDLAFADPPYNLQKLYGNYDDALAEHRYIEWCNQWLDGMARALRPGGSLFVLNLPKWAMHHAEFLNRHLEFRHWVVWDALSDPRGKIMPAHYALLWYTKPGGNPVCNYASLRQQAGSETGAPGSDFVLPPDSSKYCLRAACVKDRKRSGDDQKVELSDVWFDIHRIKHKRDRDAHPCQLPDKLMERIIRLTTNRGGWVFDPFCGAGTTAIAAAKLGRKFVVTDVDADYVRITKEKLQSMQQNSDLFGVFEVARKSVTRPRSLVSKKEIETYLQDLARKLCRVPTEADVQSDNPGMLQEIDINYPNRGAALKRAKVVLTEADSRPA